MDNSIYSFNFISVAIAISGIMLCISKNSDAKRIGYGTSLIWIIFIITYISVSNDYGYSDFNRILKVFLILHSIFLGLFLLINVVELFILPKEKNSKQEQLEKLQKLLDAGMITQEYFDEKSSKL